MRRAWSCGPAASSSRTCGQPRPTNHNHNTHVKLLALEDVAVRTSTLSRPAGQDGQKTSSLELLLEQGVDFGILLALLDDSLDVVRLLLLLGLDGSGRGLGAADDGLGVVGLVPLTEGGGVDVDNARLDESLGSEKLVVRGVVALKVSICSCKTCVD